MTIKCAACKWWKRHERPASDYGECHRHAPRDGDVEWPSTREDGFCGEAEYEEIKLAIHNEDH